MSTTGTVQWILFEGETITMSGHTQLKLSCTLHTLLSIGYKVAEHCAQAGMICKDNNGTVHKPEFSEQKTHYIVRIPVKAWAKDLVRWPKLNELADRMIFLMIFKSGKAKFIGPMLCEKLMLQRLEYVMLQYTAVLYKETVS